MGRLKNQIYAGGKLMGRNEIVAEYLTRTTGEDRTRKQVSSHIQVLKDMVGTNVYRKNPRPHVLPLSNLDSAELSVVTTEDDQAQAGDSSVVCEAALDASSTYASTPTG